MRCTERTTSDAWVACEWSHFPKSHAVIVIIRMCDAPSTEQRCCCFIMRHTKKVFVPLRTISWLIFVFPILLLQCSLGEWVNLLSKFRFTSFTSENGVVQFKTQFNFLSSCFAGQQKVHVFTATDFMLFDTNDLLYFEVLRPRNISYIYKVRPAKDFGGKFVSELQ